MWRCVFCAHKLYFLMPGHKLQLRIIDNNPLINNCCYMYVYTLEYRCVFTFTDSTDPMVTISAITSVCPWHINTLLVVIRTQCLVIRAFIDICKPFSHNNCNHILDRYHNNKRIMEEEEARMLLWFIKLY